MASAWPPPGIRPERWYFAPGRTPRLQPPEEAGEDTYTVDRRDSTGAQNRWWKLGVIQDLSID